MHPDSCHINENTLCQCVILFRLVLIPFTRLETQSEMIVHVHKRGGLYVKKTKMTCAEAATKALVCTVLTFQLTTPHVVYILTRALYKQALNSSVTQLWSKHPVEFGFKMCTSGNKCSYLSKNCHMVTNCWRFKNSSCPTIKSQFTAWSVCWFMDLFMWILQSIIPIKTGIIPEI